MEQQPASGAENIRPAPPQTVYAGAPPSQRGLFADDGPTPAAGVAKPRPAGKGTFKRVVLPLALFVVAVGAVAFVTQWLPSRGRAPDEGGGPKPAPPPPVKLGFRAPFVLWDKDDKEYRAEFEITDGTTFDGGHCDFPFKNDGNDPVEVGVKAMSCQCSRVLVCVLTEAELAKYDKERAGKDPVALARAPARDGLPWKPLDRDQLDGVVVPAGGFGIVRLFWDGKKKEPEKLGLSLDLWAGPPGKVQERVHPIKVGTEVAYVRPVRFSEERIELGEVRTKGATRAASFVCWSATRDLEVSPRDVDKCLEVTVVPITKKEFPALTHELRRSNIHTRIRSAYLVTVRAHEQRAGKQLDLGVFQKAVGLQVRAGAEVLAVTVPVVRGMVAGELRVGPVEHQNRIKLAPFKARFGVDEPVAIWAKPGPKLELEFDSVQPEGVPLQVTLKKNDKESSREWTIWELRVVVPPGVEPGPLPDDAVIVLRVQDGRRVRIPVIGTAGRG